MMLFTAMLSLALNTASAEEPAEAYSQLTEQEARDDDARQLTEHVTALTAAVHTLRAGNAPAFKGLVKECQIHTWELGHLVLSVETLLEPKAEGDNMPTLSDHLLDEVFVLNATLDRALAATPEEFGAVTQDLVKTTQHIHELSRALLSLANQAETLALAN